MNVAIFFQSMFFVLSHCVWAHEYCPRCHFGSFTPMILIKENTPVILIRQEVKLNPIPAVILITCVGKIRFA